MSHAQKTITSKVLGKDFKEIIKGAIVTTKQSKQTTLTNNKGDFTIESASVNDEISISFYGYQSISYKANNVPKTILLETSLESLNQVIISASRQKENKHDVPVAISVVTKKTMQEMQPNDISEVLNQKPGVLMVDLGNEQHMMAIRQPMTTKSFFLYLEDGLPIRPTGIFNHNALLETNAAAIENLEIIRGAYSSLYGSEAIGGAVNFITEKPTEELNIEVGTRVNNLGYQRFDGKVSGTVGKTGIYVSSYRSSIVDGFRDYGDYEKSALTAKITHQFTDKFDIENSVTYIDYRSDMSGSIGEDAFHKKDFSSIHTFTFRDAKSLRATSTLNYKWNENQNSFAKVYYRNNDLKQNPSYRISNRAALNATTKTGNINKNSFDSYGLLFQHNAKLSDVFKYSAGAVVDITINDYYAEELEVFRNADGVFESFKQLGTFASDYNTDLVNVGTFFTGEYKLTSNFRLNGGLRVDAFDYHFKNKLGASASSYNAPNTNNTFWSVTPRIGMVYKNKNYGGYANYSKGFVPPSVGELYGESDVPLLDPSKFNNYEIGTFTSLFKHSLYIDFALYYLDGEDEIVSVRTIDTTTNLDSYENKNSGSSEHYGLEYKVDYKLNKEISFRNSGSISKHKYKRFVRTVSDGASSTSFSGNDMPGAPSYINNFGIIYKPNYLKGLRLGFEWQSLGKYYTDNENTIEYNGYDVFNFRTSYKFSKIYLWMNLLNLSDKNYATRASTGYGSTTFTPGNPRNITVGIKYSIQ
ncbi:outer membrane receptor protein involved in Fe transport [Wenyingzhuangia heitensis]|uniref:Outer membrane receptor protein involved in Fe transport n=1 Tax=Wenyingzhuangia heitensis TaxID=1487859 RepID=A0ABX0UBU1_9FLAO|nr:TonB-dependent receptor [Wenyingzhuangia heitensis]NIJ46282.1 outer membrane receptor protein involved in Fe transport [Wenyingzhuangia heitensis]